jgi:hypothetical protein
MKSDDRAHASAAGSGPYTKLDDTEDKLLFRGLTTGEEVVNPVHGIQVRSRSTWIGAELLIESWMSLGGRESHFRDYWSLSSDGEILTMEHRDDALAGQITLLEKVNAPAQRTIFRLLH